MTEVKLKTGTRLSSMILDHFLMSIIAMIFFVPDLISVFSEALNVSHNLSTVHVFDNLYLELIGFSLYFCKDCINGRSIAKRILKLQIVDNTTGKVASPLKCYVRNIFCILWPIEVIVVLNNPNRRIGDWVAGTKLVAFDPSAEQPRPNILQIAMAIVLAYGITLLMMLPFNSLKDKMQKQNIEVVESSFNKQESKAVEKLFADSLGQYLTADVKVYDKIQKENLKYVSVILLLKENYLEDNATYRQLELATVSLLLTKFPVKTFVGRIQYVYKTSGNMHLRTQTLDWRSKK